MNTKISEAAVEAAKRAVYFAANPDSTEGEYIDDSNEPASEEVSHWLRVGLEAALPHLHPQPAELAEKQGVDIAEVGHASANRKLLRTVRAQGDRIAELEAALAATGKQQVGEVQGDSRAQFEAWAAGDGFDVTKVKGIYADPLTRGAWDAWRYLAARQPGAQVPVAWQINATRTSRGWESCTRECYDDTLRTGRYMGLPAGTKDVEVRALYDDPPAQGIDLGQLPDGWSLRTLATCYQLSDGNQVVGNFVGPDAKKNAALIAALIDQRGAAPGVGS